MNLNLLKPVVEDLIKQVDGLLALRGGAGSGDWGHSGRPGQVGGSGGGGGHHTLPEGHQYHKPKLDDVDYDRDQTKWLESLSEKEAYAFKHWSGFGYKSIRECQASPKDCNEFTKENFVIPIEAAAARAPNYVGTVYRGLSFRSMEDFESFVAQTVANGMVTKAFASTGKSRAGIQKFIGKVVGNHYKEVASVVLDIKVKTGISIEKLAFKPDEQEVLLRKGVKFRYKGISTPATTPPNYVIELEEV